MKTSLIFLSLLIYTISLEPESYNDESGLDISKFIIADKTNQIILVIPDEYTQPPAQLYFYIKEEGNNWKLEKQTDAYIGRDGLGKEREGDGKTPVGIYQFNAYFGIADSPNDNLPYVKVNKSHYWVGDINSDRYNQLVNIETYTDFVRSDSEHLIEHPEYEYAMNIDYNKEGEKDKGSAIFLRCLKEQQKSTGGGIVIEKEELKKIYQTLNKDCYIIIDTKKNMTKYYEKEPPSDSDSDCITNINLYLILIGILILL